MKYPTIRHPKTVATLVALVAYIVARQMGWLRGADLGGLWTAVLFLGALAIYFLPTIVGQDHPSSGGIAVVNLFLGWTLIGWVVALAWACSKPAQAPAAQKTANPQPPAPPIEDGLAKLADLRDRGMLTDEEFAAAKQRMLARAAGSAQR